MQLTEHAFSEVWEEAGVPGENATQGLGERKPKESIQDGLTQDLNPDLLDSEADVQTTCPPCCQMSMFYCSLNIHYRDKVLRCPMRPFYQQELKIEENMESFGTRMSLWEGFL